MNIPFFGKNIHIGLQTQLTQEQIMQMITASGISIDTNTVLGQAEAYKRCSTVRAVIELKASAFSNLELWAVDPNTGMEVKNPIVKEDLGKMRWYNEFEDDRKFEHHLNTEIGIFGHAFVYKLKVASTGKIYTYIIPRTRVTPEYELKGSDQYTYKKIKQLKVDLFGEIMTLLPKDFMLINGKTASYDGFLPSESPLVALRNTVEMLVAVEEMKGQLIIDGGARGIIGLGAKDQDMLISDALKKDSNNIQSELQKYGTLKQKFKYLVTRTAANYTAITSPLRDMELPLQFKDSKIQVYEAYRVPNAFAEHETRYKAKPEAVADLYDNTIIPDAKDRYRDLFRLKEIPERDWIYTVDWSHLPHYQENLKNNAIAFQQAANAIKPLIEAQVMTKEEAKQYLYPYLRRRV